MENKWGESRLETPPVVAAKTEISRGSQDQSSSPGLASLSGRGSLNPLTLFVTPKCQWAHSNVF